MFRSEGEETLFVGLDEGPSLQKAERFGTLDEGPSLQKAERFGTLDEDPSLQKAERFRAVEEDPEWYNLDHKGGGPRKIAIKHNDSPGQNSLFVLVEPKSREILLV